MRRCSGKDSQPTQKVPLPDRPGNRRDIGRDRIVSVLDDCRWKIKGPGNAADRLGIKPSTLRYRIKTLGIQRPAAEGISYS
jgi:transcriptional regulator with GAF, ATPase, and Fis domain